tara:strand:+ start:1969 stop:2742 length:774 start_codon:yes stop_codon:yes gene_type:complete
MADIIIQGGLYPSTLTAANEYSRHDMIENVIVSTWEGEHINIRPEENVQFIQNQKPDYVGPGNLNLHLLSTRNGLKHCKSDTIIKIRSDEIMHRDSITTWLNFYKNNKKLKTKNYLDGTQQKTKIHVIAANINYPYHLQDHVYIGHPDDLNKLFNMPFSHKPPIGPEPVDFSFHLRNPIYIGANYYSLFFEEAQNHLKSPEKYLLDNAPNFKDALQFYLSKIDEVFLPLPRVKLWWEKFNTEYWWDGYANSGDRYAN